MKNLLGQIKTQIGNILIFPFTTHYQEVHIRHLNPLNKIPQKVTIVEKIIANSLDYKDIEFPVSKEDYSKIDKKYLY